MQVALYNGCKMVGLLFIVALSVTLPLRVKMFCQCIVNEVANILLSLQCFGDVDWVAGRVSGL